MMLKCRQLAIATETALYQYKTEMMLKHGPQVICITRPGLDAYTITLTCTNLLTHTDYV